MSLSKTFMGYSRIRTIKKELKMKLSVPRTTWPVIEKVFKVCLYLSKIKLPKDLNSIEKIVLSRNLVIVKRKLQNYYKKRFNKA